MTDNITGCGGRHPGEPVDPRGTCAQRVDKVGLLAAKIDQLTYRMSFDLARKSGTVIINVSIAEMELLPTLL